MAGDDLLVSTGIDLAGLRRDRGLVLRQFQTLGDEITRALSTKDLIPDLASQSKQSAASVKAAYDDMQRSAAATSAAAARAAAAEKTARAQVRRELTGEIAQLSLYGRTVDVTNAKAVAAWRAEAAAIRKQSQEVGASRDQVLRLDAAVQSTERRFATMARQANIRNIGAPIDAAATSFANLNTSASKWSPIAQRAANTAVAVGFGLEGIARGGDAADAGLRTALRSVASFSALFGTSGLIVAGVAASTAAIIDLFSRARDEIRKTRETFDREIKQMAREADVIGLQVKLQDVTLDKTDLERQRAEITKFLSSFSKPRQITAVAAAASGLGTGLDLMIAGNRVALGQLDLQIKEFDRQAQILTNKILNPLPAIRRPSGLPTVVIKSNADTKAAEDALERLAKDVAAIIALTKEASEQRIIIPSLPEATVAVYDRVAAAVREFGDGTDETAAKVRKMMGDVRNLDAVVVALTRRSLLPGIEGDLLKELPPLRVRGLVQDFEIIQPKDITIPVVADVRFDPTALSHSFKDAIEKASAAQTDLDLAQLIGDRQKIADASESATIATANLRKEAGLLAAVIAASGASDDVKKQALEGIRQAAKGAEADLAALGAAGKKSDNDLISLTTGLNAIVDTGRGILNTVDAIGGIGDQARRQIGAVLDLVDATANLVALTSQGGKTLGKVGAAIGAAGGLIGVVDALLSDPEGKANRDIIRKNTETIERLRQDLEGFSSGVIDNQLAAANAIRDSSILQQRALTAGFSRGFKDVEALDRELRASGVSLAELSRLADDFGISIVDAKGRITAEGLVILERYARLSAEALATFQNTLEDFTFLQSARADIFDVPESAQRAFDESVAIITQFTDGLGVGLKGLNIETEQGRQQAEAEIRRLFDLASKNLLPPELLKGLSAEEFVKRLVEADNALDSFTETARRATGEMINVVEGFKTGFNLQKRIFEASEPGTRIRTGAAPPSSSPTQSARAPQTITRHGDVFNVTISGANKSATQLYTEMKQEALRRQRATTGNPKDQVILHTAWPP